VAGGGARGTADLRGEDATTAGLRTATHASHPRPAPDCLHRRSPRMQLATAIAASDTNGSAIGSAVLHAGQRWRFRLRVAETALAPSLGADASDVARDLEQTAQAWRNWTAGITYGGPAREHVVRSAITLKLLTSKQPARSWRRRQPHCLKTSGECGTGTTATPGCATPASPSTRCTRWAARTRHAPTHDGCARRPRRTGAAGPDSRSAIGQDQLPRAAGARATQCCKKAPFTAEGHRSVRKCPARTAGWCARRAAAAGAS
jgi:hypothetical protein